MSEAKRSEGETEVSGKAKAARSMAAARAKQAEIREADYRWVREKAAEGWTSRQMAQKKGVSLDTIQGWRRRAGCSAKPSAPRSEADKQHRTRPEGSPMPLYTLGWNILQLFDTLMAYFVVLDPMEETGQDEPVETRDVRATWTAWRVFLAAAFGVSQAELERDQNQEKFDPPAMPTYPGISVDVPRGAAAVPPGASPQTIYERCTGRSSWPAMQAKIVSLIVGRRGGKSYITAIIGIYLACCRSYKLNLGTKGMVMILARDREQAGVIRGYILAFLKAVPRLQELLADEPTQKLIALKNGITIEVRAVGDAGTRGYTVVAALTDEIAFWPTDADSVKQDRKVLRALKPAMLGIKGAMLIMLSSPYAKRGELFETYQRFYGKDDQTRVLVWNADTLSMRPDEDEDLVGQIRDAYIEDEEGAKAEYGALFRSDLESIFSREAIEAVSVPGRFEQAYHPRYAYRAFVDPSGGSADSYVLAIAHEETREDHGIAFKIPVLDKVIEWKAKFDPQAVSQEAILALKSFRVRSVTGDAYGGEWPREPFKKAGISYKLSDQTRSELYLAMLPVVNSGRCELLDPQQHRVAVNQFANLERRVGRSGKDSVDHPPGAHDDVANAIAGVIVGTASRSKVRSTW